MRIPKLPTPFPPFYEPCKIAARVHTTSVHALYDLVPGRAQHRKMRRHRIHAQVVSPSQLDPFDATSKILYARARGRAAGVLYMAIHSHKERRDIGEMPPPCRRTFLADIMRH
jgi:hypothetical protein